MLKKDSTSNVSQTGVEKDIAQYEKAKAKKQPWLPVYEQISEMVYTIKAGFTAERSKASLLNENVYDSTGQKALFKAASSFVGMLWQNGGKSVLIKEPEGLKNPTKEELDYYTLMSKKIALAFDNPKANFILAFFEYMLDQLSFGTSGIMAERSKEEGVKIKYKNVGVETWCFAEGPDGYVNKAFGEFKMSIENAAAEYGEDELSEKSRRALADGQGDQEIRILHIIRPRLKRDVDKAGNQNMPIQSTHIEIEAKHRLRDSGFEEMPVNVARFWKRTNEEYGRSLAMNAMPDILTANQVREDRLVANEKRLFPPMGVYSDSLLGTNELDTSARAVNVFNSQGLIAGRVDPTWPIFNVGDVNAANEELIELRDSINEHFFIDRLLDFNNTTQMTLGEAQMRNNIRSEAIVPLVSRQINEVLTPTTERTVSELFRMGELGVLKGTPEEQLMLANGETPIYIPERIAKLMVEGKEFYQVSYVTPAARLMQTEDAQGVLKTWEFVGQVAGVSPQVLDNIDADESLRVIGKAYGAPNGVIRTKKDVEEMRKAMAEEQQQQAAMMQEQQAAMVEQQSAQAEIMGAEAQAKRGQM